MKHVILLKIQDIMDIKEVYELFDKTCASPARSETLATRVKSTSDGAIKNEIMSNKELAERVTQTNY